MLQAEDAAADRKGGVGRPWDEGSTTGRSGERHPRGMAPSELFTACPGAPRKRSVRARERGDGAGPLPWAKTPMMR